MISTKIHDLGTDSGDNDINNTATGFKLTSDQLEKLANLSYEGKKCLLNFWTTPYPEGKFDLIKFILNTKIMIVINCWIRV